jgi:hypothetical protein
MKQLSLLLATLPCIVGFFFLTQSVLKKRSLKGKRRMIILLACIFASLGFLPLTFEPDLFGWLTPFTIYYIFAVMPPVNWSMSQFLIWTGVLFIIQTLHLGITLLAAAFMTRKDLLEE